MGWLNNFFTNITVTNNISFSNGFLSNGDGTFTNWPGFFLYSGTPAAGNLILAVTGGPVMQRADNFNNTYISGGEFEIDPTTFKFAYAVTLATPTFYSSTVANPGASWTAQASMTQQGNGLMFFVGNNKFGFNDGSTGVQQQWFTNANGALLYQGGVDTNVYHNGIVVGTSSGPTLINSTSFTAICSVTLAPNTQYKWTICAPINTNQAAGNPKFSIGHGSTATFNVISGSVQYAQDTDHSYTDSYVLDGSGSIVDWQGPLMTVGGVYCFEGRGFVGSTAGGTMVLSAATTVAADTFNVKHAFLSIEPAVN